MRKHVIAFTLIEILVASALFVSLMGLTAVAFHRISNGSEKALQVLELHAKADTILRYMESDLRNMPQTTAVHFQNTTEPYTLTFMKPVADTNPTYYHKGTTENSTNYFTIESPRLSDLVWVRWQWEGGSFSRGQSRINKSTQGIGAGSNDSYNVLTRGKMRTLDVESPTPSGMQNNAISPTPQQHYDFFEGTGSTINTIAADGSCTAGPTQKLAVYEIVNGSAFTDTNWKRPCDLVDTSIAPWRQGDYTHLYTTIELGNTNKLDEAYAVRNIDGKFVNKDRLNLLGCDEEDGNGNKIYPSQMRHLFSGVEYMNFELIGRNGRVITTTNETDRLNDGSTSIDVSGINPDNGFGYDKRPTHVRVSYLLHAVDRKIRDDEDLDNDLDADEALVDAIREIVANEGLATRLERIHSFKRHAIRQGFASVLITQSVQLGY